MHSRLLSQVAALSDPDLLRRVSLLAGQEREATVELVGHLAELDARQLHLAEGYGSLFTYCTGALRLAEHAAYNRIEAARLARRFPILLDLLADGSLNLSTSRLLAPHLRPDNFKTLVARARGRSKREVEVLVASLAPRPDVASSVRQLPARRQAVPAVSLLGLVAPGLTQPEPAAPVLSPPGPAAMVTLADLGMVSGRRADLPAPASPDSGHPSPAEIAAEASERPAHRPLVAQPTQRPLVTPLTPERYRVQFTIRPATHEKLRRAQDLLRREIPDGDPGAIFDRALTLLLDDVARKKMAGTAKPRPSQNKRRVPSQPGSRHIPARVKRAVWVRDGGRCAFVTAAGRRCTERVFLEFHHREPYALGGEATVPNVSLRCRAHNGYEAKLAFGPQAPRGRELRNASWVRRSSNSPRGESQRLPPPPRITPSTIGMKRATLHTVGALKSGQNSERAGT